MPIEKWKFRNPALTFHPPREFEEMRRRFDEDFVQPALHAVWERIPEGVKSWSPAVDIFEKGDTITVKIEVPGMKLEDIDVNVTEDTLTVKGERRTETAVKDEDYFRSEIAYGAFFRTIDLPFNIDTKSSEAVYQDGLLIINLQRAAGSKPKRVSIQVKKSTT
jgi:HSP20 family protein